MKVKKSEHQTQLSKGLAILTMLSHNALSGAEVARELGVERSTALRLLRELEDLEYVRRDPALRQYQIVEDKIYRLLPRERSGRNAADEIRDILITIRNESKEAAMFAVPADESMVYMEFTPALFPVSVREERGSVRSMWLSAVGRAYLSALPRTKVEQFVAHLSTQDAGLVATRLPELMNEIRRAQQQGYAVDRNETIAGVSCVAAPLFSRGLLVGAFGITAPSERLTLELIAKWGARLKDVPHEINFIYDTRPSSGSLSKIEDHCVEPQKMSKVPQEEVDHAHR